MYLFEGIGAQLLSQLPFLVAWLLALVFAIIMVSRGGGKAENLFLVGCILMLFAVVVLILKASVFLWLRDNGSSVLTLGIIQSVVVGIPSLAGLVCLVWAFWVRFWVKREEAG